MNDVSIINHVGPAKIPVKIHDGSVTDFQEHYFNTNNGEFVVVVKGEVENADWTLVRIQSVCVHAHIFGSLLCDCAWQLEESKRLVANSSRGIVIFALDHHGKGVGLMNHFRIYTEGQKEGYDLVIEAYEKLGLKEDSRDYAGAAAILKWFNLAKITLLTNNPKKIHMIQSHGFQVEYLPLEMEISSYNQEELRIKKEKLGHLLLLSRKR